MDAFDRRQNLNIEYLKNVFFKYLKSENKQVKFDYCDVLVSWHMSSCCCFPLGNGAHFEQAIKFGRQGNARTSKTIQSEPSTQKWGGVKSLELGFF